MILRRRRRVIRGRWNCLTCDEQVVIRIDIPRQSRTTDRAAVVVAEALDAARAAHRHGSQP